RQGMQFAAHFSFQRLVDDLVLLDARLAAKGFGYHRRGIMVAVARQIADRHLRIRNPGTDQSLDVARSHGHARFLGGPSRHPIMTSTSRRKIAGKERPRQGPPAGRPLRRQALLKFRNTREGSMYRASLVAGALIALTLAPTAAQQPTQAQRDAV